MGSGEDPGAVVATAAGISQEAWREERRILVEEGLYARLLVLVEMGLYARLRDMAGRGWLGGWGIDSSGRVAVMMPAATCLVIGSPMLNPGAWMVVRATLAAGDEQGPVGGDLPRPERVLR